MAGNRKITRMVCAAFMAQMSLRHGNSNTDGKSLFLHGNKIAKWENGKVWVTTARWDTVTTRERLNGLVNCSVDRHRGDLMLNGKQWDGEWTQL